ncbi:MAG TPA: ParA family protein [Chitinispirillaceae bacterium]|nr:ParA family protein [Chitinispirillaceae bacterium]
MRVVSILNHKGGVGKTTFSGSIAQALALIGYRVLAIDNDGQHNLSSLLGVGVVNPGIREVYCSSPEKAPSQFLKGVRKSGLPSLHIIASNRDLSNGDVSDVNQLKHAITACRLDRYYDFVIIDNAPGIDRLQAASIIASDEIFVPVELRQFAIDGLVEMNEIISERFPDGAKISRIVPNFYRSTLRQNAFLKRLNELFPGKVTETAIPVDQVFDEVVTDGKILFLHRLYSKGAAYYLKIVHELFNLSEESVWEQVKEKRKIHISNTARKRSHAKKEQDVQESESEEED